MTLAGWMVMLGSLGFVIALAGYCFYRVLRAPATKDHMHAPLDIDTGDVDEDSRPRRGKQR